MLDAVETSLRLEYWTHVKACLVRFHGVAESKAAKIITDYQSRFPITSEDPAVELIYHFEPFRLACKLTGRKLSARDFAQEYRELLEEAPSKRKTNQTGKIRIKYGTTASNSKVKESSSVQFVVAKKTSTKGGGKKVGTQKTIGAAAKTPEVAKKPTPKKKNASG